MNLLDIQNRLRQLNAQKFLSDDEHDEKERLLEELSLIRNGQRKAEGKTTILRLPANKIPEKPRREHSVVGKGMIKVVKGIIEHFKEKQVTMEEIEALKMQAVKYRLKADIAKSKRTISGNKGNVLGTTRKTGTKTRSSNYEEDIGRMLRGSVRGSTDHTMFSNRKATDIRKAFYG